jgi:SAM-dependent methyltransferase
MTIVSTFNSALKSAIKNILPASLLRAIRLRTGRRLGHLRFGDLRRTSPISSRFGSDRGTPIDRYYIESFLAEKAACIRGRVLEVGDNNYTKLFGAKRVKQSDIFHIDASNPCATIVGDLGRANVLPEAAFDCIIFTQTLQYIFDLRTGVGELYRGLKPGGVLLLTVPGITQIADEQWIETWYWSLTTVSTRRLLEEKFGCDNIEIEYYGNVFAAAAFLYGIAFEEVDRADLDIKDPSYPVTITACAVRRI